MVHRSWKWTSLIMVIIMSFVLGACATPTPVPPTKAPEPTKAPAAPAVQPTKAPEPTKAPTAVPPTPTKAPTAVPPTPTKPPPLVTKAGTPDTLIVAINGEPVRLLPPLSVGRLNEYTLALMFDSLVTHEPLTNELIGQLAESWKNIDPLTWEFKLRPNVKFHNGDPFTAEDVKFTYEVLILGDDKSPHKTFMSTVKEVQVINDLTLRIITKQPDINLPLRTMDTRPIVPKKAYLAVGPDKWDDAPVGAGPYKFVKWVRSSYLQLERFDGYWGKKAGYKNLILKFITDDAARMAAALAGEVDVASNVPPFRVDELKANKNLNVRVMPSSRTHYLVLDTTKKPFDNVKVRQAVSLAIDRAALVRAVQNGNGIPLPSVWMPLSFGYNKNIVAEYNVDKAKALLKEAGYPDGFEVTFDSFTGSITDHSKTAEAVAGMLAKVGIKCKLNITEQAVFGPLRLANKTAPIYNYSFGDQYFDHGVNMGTFVSGAQGYYYTDKALTDKINKALAEFDPAKRAVIFQDIQKDFYELAFMPGLYNMSQIWVTTQAVDWTPPVDEIWRFGMAKPK